MAAGAKIIPELLPLCTICRSVFDLRHVRHCLTACFSYDRNCIRIARLHNRCPESTSTMTLTDLSPAIRPRCPPGACDCELDDLLVSINADTRILRLTRSDEQRLLERLENLSSLADLRRIEQKMEEQVGIRLNISKVSAVRTLRGILIRVEPMPGLCRKTRKAIPAAIRKSLEKHPDIAYQIADMGGLFNGA